MRKQAPRGQGHHQQSATTRVLSCTSSPVRLRDFHRIGGCLSWQKTFDPNPTMAPPAAGKGHQRTKKRVKKEHPTKRLGDLCLPRDPFLYDSCRLRPVCFPACHQQSASQRQALEQKRNSANHGQTRRSSIQPYPALIWQRAG